jgi:hypothetical protein
MSPGAFTPMILVCICITCFYNSIHLEDVFDTLVKATRRGFINRMCRLSRTDKCRTYLSMDDELLNVLLRLLHQRPNSPATANPHLILT